jgi:hypothetical protein
MFNSDHHRVFCELELISSAENLIMRGFVVDFDHRTFFASLCDIFPYFRIFTHVRLVCFPCSNVLHISWKAVVEPGGQEHINPRGIPGYQVESN